VQFYHNEIFDEWAATDNDDANQLPLKQATTYQYHNLSTSNSKQNNKRNIFTLHCVGVANTITALIHVIHFSQLLRGTWQQNKISSTTEWGPSNLLTAWQRPMTSCLT